MHDSIMVYREFFCRLGKGVKGGAVSHVRTLVMNIYTILKCQGDRWIFLPMLAVDGVVTMSDELLGKIYGMGVGVHNSYSQQYRKKLPSSALKERLGHHKTEGSNQVFLPKFSYIQYI